MTVQELIDELSVRMDAEGEDTPVVVLNRKQITEVTLTEDGYINIVFED